MTLVVLLFGIAWVCATWFLSSPLGAVVFDADHAQPFLVARDIAGDAATIHGWLFPEAPAYFPDLLLVCVCRGMFGSFRAATLACTVMMAFGWLASAQALTWSVLEDRRRWVGGWVCLVLSLTTFVAGCHFSTVLFQSLYSSMLLVYHHSGALACTTLSLAVSVMYLRRGGLGSLVVLALISLLASTSDRLYVAEATLPVVITCMLLFLWRGSPRRRLTLLACLVAATASAGSVAGLPLGRRQESAAAGMVSLGASLRQLVGDGRATFSDHTWYGLLLVAVPIVISVVALLSEFAAQSRHVDVGDNEETWARRFLFVSIFVSVLATLSALLVSGRYLNLLGLRFLQNIALLQVSASVVLARWLPRESDSKLSRHLVAGATGLVCLVLSVLPQGDLQRFLGYQSEAASCISEVDRRTPLMNGLAGYWEAKSAEVEVDPRIKINQIFSSGQAYTWNTSLIHYLGSGRDWAEIPEYDFIVENGLNAIELDRTFGPPDQREVCRGCILRVYNHPNALSATVLRASPHLFDLMFAQYGRVAIPAWAWAEKGFDLRLHTVHVRGPAGVVLAGSISVERALRYTVEYKGSAPKGPVVGSWEIGLQRSGDPHYQPFSRGVLTAASEWKKLQLDSVRPPRIKGGVRVHLRVAASEGSTLDVRQVLATTPK